MRSSRSTLRRERRQALGALLSPILEGMVLYASGTLGSTNGSRGSKRSLRHVTREPPAEHGAFGATQLFRKGEPCKSLAERRSAVRILISTIIAHSIRTSGGQGSARQVSLAYSAIVRSLENFPDAATFKIATRAHSCALPYNCTSCSSACRWRVPEETPRRRSRRALDFGSGRFVSSEPTAAPIHHAPSGRTLRIGRGGARSVDRWLCQQRDDVRKFRRLTPRTDRDRHRIGRRRYQTPHLRLGRHPVPPSLVYSLTIRSSLSCQVHQDL